MALNPEVLVPCHGSHLEGKDPIREVLTNYRDAIRHVYHYTLEAAGKFQPIQEAAAEVAPPSHLAQLPYLKQYYGYLPTASAASMKVWWAGSTATRSISTPCLAGTWAARSWK
jgi:alkyl sulfatase BDS1-like metallo-beta-lactamase superfamily hydrolase